MDSRQVMGLLNNLEVHAETSTKANEELQFLEDCRSRFGQRTLVASHFLTIVKFFNCRAGIGVESLPAPLMLGMTPEDSDEKARLRHGGEIPRRAFYDVFLLSGR